MPHEMEESGAEVSDPMSENDDETEIYFKDDEKMTEQSTTESTTEVKKKYDPKDPLRPRRKKARRACFACQRAHLTCGKSSSLTPLCSLDVGLFCCCSPVKLCPCVCYAALRCETDSRLFHRPLDIFAS